MYKIFIILTLTVVFLLINGYYNRNNLEFLSNLSVTDEDQNASINELKKNQSQNLINQSYLTRSIEANKIDYTTLIKRLNAKVEPNTKYRIYLQSEIKKLQDEIKKNK
jgi:hypothetical protein